MPHRTVKALHAAQRDDIGDLVTRRPLPGPGLDQVDPFLFLNHHGPQSYGPDNHGLPFGPHPHRGFETVTFILEGSLAHHDSGGHESVIEAGGVQWMTAGSGLVHAEVSPEDFKRSGGDLEILQLWLNLPARLKMTAPAYRGLQRADIPALASDGGRVTVNLIAGEYEGKAGPFRPLTGVFMSTVELTAGGRVVLPAPAGRSVFLYVVRGDLRIAGTEAGGTEVGGFRLVELNDDGDTVEIEATGDAAVLYGHADPIGEPVVSYGPFVMNSREEIEQAVRDYRAGRFG
ncbi:MAG: pirin family protein [Thalassobaculum sp.]|uniref:pirin family protein n=1 Tax=Thalassobaculum sp. TaxID=2022740 RepID=UPI0032EBE0CE